MLTARNKKVIVCLAFALLQGLCLSMLPGAAVIFKSTDFNGISDHLYGLSFIPQVVFSILVTFMMERVLKYVSRGVVFRFGILCLCGHLLCTSSLYLLSTNVRASFTALLVANGFLGLGFGCFVSIANIFMAEIFPAHEEKALTGLHAMIGVGAAASPFLIRGFHAANVWFMAPVLTLIMILVTLVVAVRKGYLSGNSELAKKSPHVREELSRSHHMPWQAQLLLLMILLYGVIEAMMGNWLILFIHHTKHISFQSAVLALSIFWIFLTVGRVLSALLIPTGSAVKVYVLLPAIFCLGFFELARATSSQGALLATAVIGIGCSAFFPMTLGFAIQMFPKIKETLATVGMTALMVGVGIGSTVVGLLSQRKIFLLSQSFNLAVAISFVLLLLSLIIARLKTRVR